MALVVNIKYIDPLFGSLFYSELRHTCKTVCPRAFETHFKEKVMFEQRLTHEGACKAGVEGVI